MLRFQVLQGNQETVSHFVLRPDFKGQDNTQWCHKRRNCSSLAATNSKCKMTCLNALPGSSVAPFILQMLTGVGSK